MYITKMMRTKVLVASIVTTGFCGMIFLDTKMTSLDSKMTCFFAAFENRSDNKLKKVRKQNNFTGL
jgi:hypothetical protein